MNVKSAILVVGCLMSLQSGSGVAVEITEVTHEGRPHFRITTESATWYYDRRGGGLSSLIDRDGKDWIAFHKDPLTKFPASAAAGYRGIPNAVFVGPDKGAGHPGFDKCTSHLEGHSSIVSESISGKWRWRWQFEEHQAVFTMERADAEHPWWFLYEGPIAGSFAPRSKVWGTDKGGPQHNVPSSRDQQFDEWRWAYFADKGLARSLLIVQHRADELPDTIWYLGSSHRGSPLAPDGMVVFGFGRGPGTKPQFVGAEQQFTVALLEQGVLSPADHSKMVEHAARILAQSGKIR